MSFLQHIQHCNQYQPSHFIPFIVSKVPIGQVKQAFAQQLIAFSNSFSISNNALHWAPSVNGFDALNVAMSALTDDLLKARLIPYRHHELYPATAGHRDHPLFLIDRALVPYFGIAAFGQHINGFVRRHGEIFMWIARRSKHKRHAPGKLDNLVAGGLPWGLTLEENLAKECWEEAGIPAGLASQAQQVSEISYLREYKLGLKPDTMICYDLELPEDFSPRCTDGEVESFQLLSMEQVAKIIQRSDDFKLNCNLVIIDFLIRHQYIPSTHNQYKEIVHSLNAIDLTKPLSSTGT